MNNRTIILLFTFSLFLFGIVPQDMPLPERPQIVHARILNYGIYEAVKRGIKYDHKESTAGYAEAGGETVLIKNTTQIPLKKGILFGFEWEAEGFPYGIPVKIIYRIKHPPTKKPNGEVSTGFDELFPLMPEDGKIKTEDYYRLSEDWELLPGEWTLSVLFEDKVLVEKIFYISDKY